MLWTLWISLDYSKYESNKVKDILQFIFPNSAQLSEMMKDLEFKMKGPENKDNSSVFDIANIFAFEAYLYWLKMWVDNYVKSQTKLKEFDILVNHWSSSDSLKRFEFLERLTARNNINKYYWGKSTGLADLVEHLFLIKFSTKNSIKNAFSDPINEQIYAIEKFGDPILNWLSNSLIYHVDTEIMKRYIKIIVNQGKKMLLYFNKIYTILISFYIISLFNKRKRGKFKSYRFW